MIEFLLATLAFAGTLSTALAAYLHFQGDCNIYFDCDNAGDFSVTRMSEPQALRCRCMIPLVNQGKQQGMLLNVFCQPLYCGKIMEQLEFLPRLHRLREPFRKGDYWEAVIVKKNSSQMVELGMAIHSLVNLDILIREVPRLTCLIHYQTVGRRGFHWRLSEISFDLSKSQKPGDPIHAQ
jgi:hypothetical protein